MRLDVDPESDIAMRRTDRFLSYMKHPTDAWIDKIKRKLASKARDGILHREKHNEE